MRDLEKPADHNEPPARNRSHLVLVISDGTGVTGERVIRAALAQFDPESVMVERVSQVVTAARITAAIEQAALHNATVLYSIVSAPQRRHLLHEARRHHVWTIDLLGPILRRLSDVLEMSPRSQPGLFRELDEEYFRRIDAIDFAVKHDDGMMSQDLPAADLVLVGVSRTSKTPLSMFLAYRGWRVANVPIVLGIAPPLSIFEVDPSKVIALEARPAWLEGVRRERALRMAREFPITYAEMTHIRQELAWFRGIVEHGGWRTVEVTSKAIEETAAEIVDIVRD
jgi:[pyruvate, water dikinase]-phosphate phosphotransferase / [pyruvate, water dikinase] kinase